LSKKKFPYTHVEMKFNDLTYNISFVLLIVAAIYTLLYGGLAGILLCTSFSLITAAFVNQFEIVVAASVIFALTYIFYLKPLLRKLEPFENLDTPEQIADRLAKMKSGYKEVPQNLQDPYLEPAGVYNPAIEGFQDVQPNTHKEGESASSSSAPSKRTNEVELTKVKEVTSAVQGANDKKDKELASATGTLFKDGKLPSENKDGPMLDSGSTLLKAMETFQPEQIQAMTADSKKLLETQKGLMEMLTQMRPVLSEGKELLQTFSGMFGGSGGPLKLA